MTDKLPDPLTKISDNTEIKFNQHIYVPVLDIAGKPVIGFIGRESNGWHSSTREEISDKVLTKDVLNALLDYFGVEAFIERSVFGDKTEDAVKIRGKEDA